jgi:hypothetical protein
MNTHAIDWWRERLRTGSVFHSFEGRVEGVDFKRSKVDKSSTWPSRVARDTMYNDYVNWLRKRSPTVAPGLKSEFFRLMAPYFNLYGGWHRARHDVNKQLVEGDRILEGRVQRYFYKLPPLEVMQAKFNLTQNSGTVTQLELCRQVIKVYGERLDLTEEEQLADTVAA